MKIAFPKKEKKISIKRYYKKLFIASAFKLHNKASEYWLLQKC